MSDVFVSYSHEDRPVAKRFAESLEREGFSVWWDQSISAGETFDKVTEKALKDARSVVVLWSKRSVESRWVRSEATQADRYGMLVPVMIEACDRPIMFELSHTVDLSGWNGATDDPRWRAFIEGLRKTVGRSESPAIPGTVTAANATPAPTAARASGALRRPHLRLRVQGQSPGPQGGRPDARRRACAGRQCAPLRRPAAHHHTADQGRHRLSPVVGNL